MRKLESTKSNSVFRSTDVSKNRPIDIKNYLDCFERNTAKIIYKKVNEKTFNDAKIAQERKKLMRENFLVFKEKIK